MSRLRDCPLVCKTGVSPVGHLQSVVTTVGLHGFLLLSKTRPSPVPLAFPAIVEGLLTDYGGDLGRVKTASLSGPAICFHWRVFQQVRPAAFRMAGGRISGGASTVHRTPRRPGSLTDVRVDPAPTFHRTPSMPLFDHGRTSKVACRPIQGAGISDIPAPRKHCRDTRPGDSSGGLSVPAPTVHRTWPFPSVGTACDTSHLWLSTSDMSLKACHFLAAAFLRGRRRPSAERKTEAERK